VNVTTPGNRAEFFRVQGVHTDVHPVDACPFKIFRHIGQADAVCGQAQVADSGGLDQGNEANDVRPQKGLSARQTNFSEPESIYNGYESRYFFRGKNSGLLDMGNPCFRNAIDTLQVAPVRDRDPEIIDAPAEGIFQRGALHHLCVLVHALPQKVL
jgi:hypothetical protein